MSSKGDINTQISSFVQQLKRRQISGSKEVALATANLLIRYISARRWTSTEIMVQKVRELGVRLVEAQPFEFTCGNVVRRVLKSIRTIDEAITPAKEGDQSDEEQNSSASMFGLLSIQQQEFPRSSAPNQEGRDQGLTPGGLFANETERQKARDRRNAVVDEINILIDEIQNDDPLFKAGTDLITPHDVILTPCPASNTVFEFLKRLASKRQVSVIVTESYPNGVESAKKTVERLNSANVAATLIPDAAVYAIMPKVSKVVISARAVLANGGCIASSGVAMACHAAKQFRKPVLMMAGSYKLSPIYPYDAENLIEVGNSGKVVDFRDAELMDKLEVLNPLYDYIPPELVEIVITADGGASPNFVYRLILDNYSVQDQNLA